MKGTAKVGTSSLASVIDQRLSQTNDNGIKNKKNQEHNVNDNGKDTTAVNSKNDRAYADVDLMADDLVRTFGSERSRRFYCKVLWKLGRERTQRLVSIATADGTRNPGGLFNVLARRELGEI